MSQVITFVKCQQSFSPQSIQEILLGWREIQLESKLSLSHVCFTFSTERQFSGGHFHLCGQTGQTDPISETNDGVILTLKSRFEATLAAERCRGTFRHIDLKIRLLDDGKSHKALPSRVHLVILILDDNKRQEEN